MELFSRGGIMVPVAMFGWVPFVALLFLWLPPRRAVLTAFLLGWFLLPCKTQFKVEMLPAYDKVSAIGLLTLACALIADPQSFLRVRPRWYDIPMLVFCCGVFVTSVMNGLGEYDGGSAVLGRVVPVGFPYILGRVYFGEVRYLREILIGLGVAAICLLPFLWYEMRMAPMLHYHVYGISLYSTMRYGLWRPSVFLYNGLILGMWLTILSMVMVTIWRYTVVRRFWLIPVGWATAVFVVTTFACVSTGALVLLVLGLAALFAIWRLGWGRAVVIALALMPLFYISVRATGSWSGDIVVETSRDLFGEDRAGSLLTRIVNEDALSERAWLRPVWGWGGWGRNRVRDEQGRDISLTDGYWIIVFGVSGLVGLVSYLAMVTIPPIKAAMMLHGRMWRSRRYAPVVCFAIVIPLWTMDNLLNAMVSPVLLLILGGMAGLRREAPAKPRQRASAGEGNASSVLNSSASAASEPW